MKNKAEDLNNHLFKILEDLSDDDNTGEKLKETIKRAQAMTDVASKIIELAKVQVVAACKLTEAPQQIHFLEHKNK